MDDERKALRDEATAWVVRITSGTATQTDIEELNRWRALSAEHDRVFREEAGVWKKLGPAFRQGAPHGANAMTRRAFIATGSMAAGGAGVAFGLSQLGFLPSLASLTADHSTAVGEQTTIALPDGSKANLDGGSSLFVEFSDSTRRVVLAEGAAVFDVVEGRRPFEIAAQQGVTIARRASVSIQSGTSDVLVDCLDGEVGVTCLSTTDLIRGEAVSYSATGLGEKTASDTETAAAWRHGLLIFKDRPLADVVADVNRHRRGNVMIARPSLRSKRISGVFHLERPDEILAHLEATFKVRPISLAGGVVLLQ